MIAIFLALLAAGSYGASDFAGGFASRRHDSVVVNLVGQIVAVTVLVAALAVTGGHLSQAALGWGALAGVGSGVDTLALYRGLARGRMAVVAPLSAAVAAILPVFFGFAVGDSPAIVTDAGVVVALPAVVLISMTGAGAKGAGALWSSAGDGLTAGAGFALLFIALSRTHSDAGLWPSVVSGTVSLAIITAVAAPRLLCASRQRMSLRDGSTAALAGVLGACGSTTFLLASRSGMLAIVAVVTSLYPAVTVLLARGVLRETVGRVQLGGLALAALGVTLIATG